MRRVLFLSVGLLTACEGRGRECTFQLLVPEGVSAPVEGATDFTVRFLNSSPKPVGIDALEVEGEGFRVVSEARSFTLPRGSCEKPSEVGVVLQFAPSSVGRRAGALRFLRDGEPASVTLEANGLGPVLAASELVNLGLTGLEPSFPKPLELMNEGTLGTSLEARLESLVPEGSNTTPDELCLGLVRDGQCVPGLPLSVTSRASVELVATPRTTGQKAWTVTFSAGTQRRATRVIAEVVDTSHCQLESSVTELTFPMVLAPERSVQHVTFTNAGSGPCVLRGATVSAAFRVFGRPPFRLEAGDSFELAVETSLQRPGSARGRLELAVATSVSSQLRVLPIELRAETPASCLVTSPSTLDFGTVATGCSAREQTVVLTNQCSSPLLITGLSTAGPFTVTDPLELPHVLQPAQQRRITVRLGTPSAFGLVTGGLVFSLDPGVAVVSLFARAEPRPPRSQVFFFEPRVELDVLFVLDDSPTFARHHQHVRNELAKYRLWAEARTCGLNVQVGFTTTDVSASGPRGRLRTTDGGVRWASGDAVDFAATFDRLSVLSTTGAEHQSCLEASARAVSEPLASDPSGNRGFRRAGSFLAVFCATDDREPVLDPTPWREALLDAGPMSYYVLGPRDPACQVDALDDGRHADNVTALDGALVDLCSPWDITPSDAFLCNRRTTYFLTGTPDAAGVSVVLDGRPLLERSGAQVNWRYEPATNTVVVDPSVFGRDPSQLVIRYQTACP